MVRSGQSMDVLSMGELGLLWTMATLLVARMFTSLCFVSYPTCNPDLASPGAVAVIHGWGELSTLGPMAAIQGAHCSLCLVHERAHVPPLHSPCCAHSRVPRWWWMTDEEQPVHPLYLCSSNQIETIDNLIPLTEQRDLTSLPTKLGLNCLIPSCFQTKHNLRVPSNPKSPLDRSCLNLPPPLLLLRITPNSLLISSNFYILGRFTVKQNYTVYANRMYSLCPVLIVVGACNQVQERFLKPRHCVCLGAPIGLWM